MEEQKFREKIQLILDPYFDREFFTNLIYVLDRKKTLREVFEACVRELDGTKNWSADLDKSLLHLFFGYQVSSLVKENYQLLPLANSIYAMALNRGDGQKLVESNKYSENMGQASTPQEFESLIRKDVRGVESKSSVWGALLFLLDNRSTRAKAAAALIKESLINSDALTFSLLVKGMEVALSSGWKANASIMKRPFDRFWESDSASDDVARGVKLATAIPIRFNLGTIPKWQENYAEELWKRISEQSAESAWEYISNMANDGASFDQVSSVFSILRGRALFSMKSEQWPLVTKSIVYSEALQSAGHLAPEEKLSFLAIDLFDLVQLIQLVGNQIPSRATGESVLDGVSKNISKDRLVLRLDDSLERGDRTEALELIAVILKDEGLSGSVCDRLLLAASKQDAWTYDFRTIPVAYAITKSFNACVRLGIHGSAVLDGLSGLIRFLSDQREASLMIVPKTGTYGNGLSLSQFDVSGGARIVDRFIFNQLRNAQRVKVWPSDN
ncbi:MAG: hypothetical protein JWQ35_2501 [Bacteriovoracaceae bacterium]|nr:hypothetical protein [Bacteriovoracaceae bacterium]